MGCGEEGEDRDKDGGGGDVVGCVRKTADCGVAGGVGGAFGFLEIVS